MADVKKDLEEHARKRLLQVDVELNDVPEPQIVETAEHSSEVQYSLDIESEAFRYFIENYGTPQDTTDIRVLYAFGLHHFIPSSSGELIKNIVGGIGFYRGAGAPEGWTNNIFTTSPFLQDPTGTSASAEGLILQDRYIVTGHEICHLLTEGSHYTAIGFNQNLMRAGPSTWHETHYPSGTSGAPAFKSFFLPDKSISIKGSWRLNEQQEEKIRSSDLLSN